MSSSRMCMGHEGTPCSPAIPVAGVEVVGRSISLFVPKLGTWNAGTVDVYDPNLLQHRIHLSERPSGEDQHWVHLGRSQFRWLTDLPAGSPANPTYAGKPRKQEAVGWRIRVFWPAMGRWYQGKIKDWDASTGKHLVLYKDGDVQNAMLRNEAVEWLDKPSLSARSGSPQKARSRASSGTTHHADGSSPVSRARPTSNGPSSPQRKRSRLQSASQGAQPLRVSKSGQSVKRGSAGGEAGCAEQLQPAASTQTSKRPEADAQAPLRVVNSVAEHQAKRARSSQADAQTAKPRAPPSSLQTGTRPPAQPTQATSSTTAPSHGVHAGSPALTVDRSTNFETSQTPAVPNPGLHGAASFGEGPVPKRKGPPSVLASIVVAMDEPSGTQAGKPLKKSAKHAMADGWSLPAGLYASTHPSSSGPGSENHMQARLDSHAQAGPRIAPMSGESSNVRGRGTSCKPGFQSQGGVIAKMTSGRGRGHKGAWKKARGAQDHLSRLGGMNGSQGGVNSPIPGPGGRLPQSSSAPGSDSPGPPERVMGPLGDAAPFSNPQQPVELHDMTTPCSSHPEGPHSSELESTPAPPGRKLGAASGKRKNSANPCIRDHMGEDAADSEEDLYGVRLSIYWTQDAQFYKATIVVYDSYHKRCKVQYDDGEEEWLALPKQRFRWLLPRAQSAGCNQAIQASLAAVGAEGIQPFWHRNPCLEGASPNDQGTPTGVQSVPKREAAVGGRLMLRFAPTGEMFGGEVLAWNDRKRLHHILYDDGEEEWVCLCAEKGLVWQGHQRGSSVSPGIPAGQHVPKGRAAVGWRIAVHWREDAKFYAGEVISFDTATGKHQVLYDDGEKEHISLTSEKVKWVLPPSEGGTAQLKKASRTERCPSLKRGRGRPRHHHPDDSLGGSRPSKRPRLKHSHSPRTALLLHATSAAYGAATPFPRNHAPGVGPDAGLGHRAEDDLSGVEPVLQRDVLPGSLSAKLGNPVAVERVRLICRSLQDPTNTSVDDDDAKSDDMDIDVDGAPGKQAGSEPPTAANAVDEATEDWPMAGAATSNETEAAGCEHSMEASVETGMSSEGAAIPHARPAAGGSALQQRQKFMQRMQSRLAGLSMPPTHLPQGLSGASVSPLMTPLASPSSTVWASPLTSPLPLPSASPAQTHASAQSTHIRCRASSAETPNSISLLQSSTPKPTSQPSPDGAPGPEGRMLNPLPGRPVLSVNAHEQAASAPQPQPQQPERPARLAIKPLRGLGRMLHVTPSPLGGQAQLDAHPGSIVRGIVDKLQNLHTLPHPAVLQAESRRHAGAETASHGPHSSSLSPTAQDGRATQHAFHDDNDVVDTGAQNAADHEPEPPSSEQGQASHDDAASASDLCETDSTGAESLHVDHPAGCSAIASVRDSRVMQSLAAAPSLSLDAAAKQAGSRHPSVGTPHTPSLGDEERGLFSAALRALDSGAGGSMDLTGLGPSNDLAAGGC